MSKLPNLFAPVLVCLALALAPTAAAAGPGERTHKSQKQSRKSKARSARTSADRPVKKYDFLGDKLSGEIMRPGGDTATAAGKIIHTSLIRIRTQFVDRVLKSAENL